MVCTRDLDHQHCLQNQVHSKTKLSNPTLPIQLHLGVEVSVGVLSYSVAQDAEAALLTQRMMHELASAPHVVEPQQPERPEQQVERPAERPTERPEQVERPAERAVEQPVERPEQVERPAEERPEQQRPEVPEQLVGPAGAG